MVDGERLRYQTKSRAHLCMLAATNDWSVGRGDHSKDTALLSRFDVVFPTTTKVPNKSILDLMAISQSPTGLDAEGAKDMDRWVRTTQKCIYWIFRLIHLGAIEAVNLDAVHAVIGTYRP